MDLKLNIDYENLLQLIKQLPSHQLDKLKSDLSNAALSKAKDSSSASFQDFLLSGPTISDEEYSRFLENRKSFSKWRTK